MKDDCSARHNGKPFAEWRKEWEMEERYNFRTIESKWQKIWDEEKAYKVEIDRNREKFYVLVEFPYPSGAGLHVGHPRSYTALDVVARKKRMQGFNVLYPMGFDAFGLPAENYAIKTGVHPAVSTKANIENFTRQLKSIGFSFDWDRCITTCDPEYYKWTQWMFIKFFEKGLAYKDKIAINWCPSCKVGLANEEVVNGRCERCGAEVVRKNKEQWMIAITKYADRLIEDLNELDFIDRVKSQQINWIGRSEGAELDFGLTDKEGNPLADRKLTVFTTRPDTAFGVTYMVLAPEHKYVAELADRFENKDEIRAYVEATAKKSELQRTMDDSKTGVELKGVKARNPYNGELIPVFISDYVLTGYGTGAIMAVPAHDQRDYDFAKAFNLPIVQVLEGGDIAEKAWEEDGAHINSGFLNGMNKEDGMRAAIDHAVKNGFGRAKVNFKLRDWVFSRQRYWGEPIPMVYCEHCGWQPVPESELPLKLPQVPDYHPNDEGESPLSKASDWVNTTCPKCGGKARRETDVMPNWAGSSWYFLRYCDPHNDREFASKEALDYWMNVDWYNGGMEHTTLHLLYSRFWHKFLYDQGVVPTPEPYQKRTSHGMILGSNGEKMSKSRGNVVNPDDIVQDYGADTLRTYEMFIGAFDLSASWSEEGVKGCRRFLERVWKLQDILTDEEGYSADLETKMHQTIKKVSSDFENLKYNTAIAAMMSLINEFYKKNSITRGEYKTLLTLLNPVAPHITEELWQTAGFEGRLYQAAWPEYEEEKTVENVVEIGVQVNGKMRVTINVSKDETRENVIAMAKEALGDKLTGNIVKEIYVPGRIVNIVAK